MRKLTRKRWARTLAEDLASLVWIIWKAFVSFVMFEFTDMLIFLLLAWIHLRYEHTVVKKDDAA